MTNRKDPIVVGVDGSLAANHALAWAAELAAARRVPLRIVHAIGVAESYGSGHDVVKRAAATAHTIAPEVAVHCVTPIEAARRALIEEATSAGFVVVGARGRGGFAGMLTGSTALHIVAHAPVPVAVVRGRGPKQAVPNDGVVVAGVDGSAVSEPVLAHAFEQATRFGSELVVVHCTSDAESADDYRQAQEADHGGWDWDRRAELDRWQEKYPSVAIRRLVSADRPRHVLLDQSLRARLVLVGTRGRGGVEGLLLGSTSQALVLHAQCPALITRAAPLSSTG